MATLGGAGACPSATNRTTSPTCIATPTKRWWTPSCTRTAARGWTHAPSSARACPSPPPSARSGTSWRGARGRPSSTGVISCATLSRISRGTEMERCCGRGRSTRAHSTHRHHGCPSLLFSSLYSWSIRFQLGQIRIFCSLKVPKCEIFDPFHTSINPIWIGDLRTGEFFFSKTMSDTRHFVFFANAEHALKKPTQAEPALKNCLRRLSVR